MSQSPAFDPLTVPDSEPTVVRASGQVLCPTCSKPYRDHPWFLLSRNDQGRPFLHLLCDGTVVKL